MQRVWNAIRHTEKRQHHRHGPTREVQNVREMPHGGTPLGLGEMAGSRGSWSRAKTVDFLIYAAVVFAILVTLSVASVHAGDPIEWPALLAVGAIVLGLVTANIYLNGRQTNED